MDKTREEVDELKRQWKADPCWDICETEGFEAYRDELQRFQAETEQAWKKEYESRMHRKAFGLGVSYEMAVYIDMLETRLAGIEGWIDRRNTEMATEHANKVAAYRRI